MTLEPCLVIGRICVWSLELNSFYLLSGLYFILLIWDGFTFLFDMSAQLIRIFSYMYRLQYEVPRVL